MSEGQVAAFAAAVQDSNTLQAEIRALAADVDRIVAIGRREGFTFTAAELSAYQESVRAESGRELRDEELEKVSGAGWSGPNSSCRCSGS
jgi:predicted ribosomally synthesized peptide with nif11-like leader